MQQYVNQATAEEYLQLGLKYYLGQGVAANIVEAHKWFNLSAMNGCAAARAYRSDLASEMSHAEIAAAQRAAREACTVH